MVNTQGLRDSTFFTEIFAEVFLKGHVRIAERPLCGSLRLSASPRLCDLCVLSPEKESRTVVCT